ncbi:MAG: SLC13 family permease [Thermoguttaceae bacterium]|nr:SLC13 family permease [Thermoguttaceae bacterium]MDW8038451.1 SLC13 family permease [Thermoguttaceae bacterium]
MGWEGWLTLSVVAVVIAALATSRFPPEVLLVGGLTVLVLSGVLEVSEALAGFANEGMITIGVLFIVSGGLIETGAVHWLAERLFGRPRSEAGAIWRVMAPSALFSAFMNNTPLVAMLLPAVHDWARRNKIHPSKVLMPLSYAAILGGTCTLIGTSTNLVVNGMVIQAFEAARQLPIPSSGSGQDVRVGAGGQLGSQLPSPSPASFQHPAGSDDLLAQQAAGQSERRLPRGLRLLDISWVGIPTALAGIGFMMFIGRRLLPERTPSQPIQEDPRQYTVEMMVEPGSPLVGKTIEQAGLRHLPGVFLAEIEREGMLLPAVGPQERLRAGDRLVFVGVVESVVDLQKIRGLVPAPDQIFKLDTPRPDRCLLEAVVSESCPIVGKSIRDGRFRSIYGAVVIAVSRHGQRIPGKIGDIVLQAGDTLLLEAHPSFLQQHRNSRDFFLVSRLENSSPPRFERAAVAIGILLSMVGLVAVSEWLAGFQVPLAGWVLQLAPISMFKAGLVAAALMLLSGCCRLEQARRAVDGRLLVAIAAALGLGLALEKTGAAKTLVLALLQQVGEDPWWALVVISVATSLITELVTNNAAAALMTPFALATANQLDVNPMAFIISVMMAASSSFATPLGYQTNLMVYGPGGYRFGDFLKVGIPMNLLVLAITVVLAPRIWPF